MKKLVAHSLQLVAGRIRATRLLQATSYKLQANRGFTLLLAALVASIVLALGTAIFEIAQKQLILSSLGRDSQFAFYAADTAAECALFWDFRCNYFATSTSAMSPSCNNPEPLCDTRDMKPFDPDRPNANTYPYTMTSQKINLFSDVAPAGNFCAQVSVTKSKDAVTNTVRTLINADGYSVDCNSISASPRALQRTVQLRY